MSTLSTFDDPLGSDPPPPAVVRVQTSDVRPGVRLRTGKLNRNHLDAIVMSDGDWPPVVIRRADMTIVDGHYRYMAACQLGHTHIDCVYFDGREDSAFLEALRRNRDHGLPLSFRDREAAAREVMKFHPDWSDRRLGAACGLAPGTVGRIRSAVHGATGQDCQLNIRVGRDGRRRPVDPNESRIRVISALRAQPEASLREIARVARVSPATVRAVRAASGSVERHAPDERPVEDDHRIELVPEPAPDICQPLGWVPDAAVVSTTEGENFAKWFERTNLGEEWRAMLSGIPFSRVYEVADEARRRASAWQEFANSVEARARGRQAIRAL